MRILLLGSSENTRLARYLKETEEEVFFLAEKVSIEEIQPINPDYIISYNYQYIIGREIVNLFRDKLINLHISLLPWNRGTHPNFWSFWENTAKGVTVHYIDEGIDTGDIIAQKEIDFNDDETLFSSYSKLQEEVQLLFIDNWAQIKSGSCNRITQPHRGTFHTRDELKKIAVIFGDDMWNLTIREVYEIKDKVNQN